MLIVATCVFAKPAQFNENGIRNKRSFSWMPTYLGGTPAVSSVEKSPQGSTIGQEYLEISDGDSVSGDGQVMNSQLLYPIWDTNQYRGLNLQPHSIAFMQNVDGSESVLPSMDRTADTWLTPELIQMARELGVKDFSKTPSLQDVMNLLGTTSKETTIEAIKKLAATNTGGALIREYIEGRDNEVAASENVENLSEVEHVEAAGNTDSYDTSSTDLIAQYLLPYNQAQLISQFGPYESSPVQANEQYEADEIQTNAPENFIGRVTQWANFLNPLTNRQEIPIPQILTESVDQNSKMSVANTESTANQHTIQIPELPELPPLPNIPVVEQAELALPELPNVHIPYRYTSPVFPYISDAALRSGNTYVSDGAFVQPENTISFVDQPIEINEPSHVFDGVQPFTSQYLPQTGAQQFQVLQPVTVPIDSQVSDDGQLPLVDSSNYEVFKNAPRIISSYGSPAVPYSYGEILSPNTFYISPQASKAYIHQEYEILPLASDVFEQVAEVNEPLQSKTDATIKQEDEQGSEVNDELGKKDSVYLNVNSSVNGKVEQSQSKQIKTVSKEEKAYSESKPTQIPDSKISQKLIGETLPASNISKGGAS